MGQCSWPEQAKHTLIDRSNPLLSPCNPIKKASPSFMYVTLEAVYSGTLSLGQSIQAYCLNKVPENTFHENRTEQNTEDST